VLVELSKMEQRYQAVMAVQVDGLSVTEVADKWGVSRQSVHAWLRRYETGGLEGLADRSHRPASCPHQMPAAVEARVCELRRTHPFWGPVRIAHQLGREGLEAVPSHMGIWRALVRHGLIDPKATRKRLPTFKRWERGRPMELWQLDVVGGVLLADGTEAKILTGVDDHSRFCVASGIMTRAVARAVCGIFAQSLRTYGVPDEVLTDNGKVFTDRFGRRHAEVLFDRICREKASPTASPRPIHRRRRARSNASTAPFAWSSSPAACSPTFQAPKPSLTPGWRTTTPTVPTKALGCVHRRSGSWWVAIARLPSSTPTLWPSTRPAAPTSGSPARSRSTGLSPWPGSRSRSASTGKAVGSTSMSSPRSSRSGTATSSSRP
jgi:transposase